MEAAQEIQKVLDFMNKYQNFFVNETPKNINFSEELLFSEIDTSLANEISPEEKNISFQIFVNGKDYADVSCLEDLRELNGDSYKNRDDRITIKTKIYKSLFIDDLKLDNCYLFFRLENFFKQLNRHEWKNERKKMNIIILDNSDLKFESSFLCIYHYSFKNQLSDSYIPSESLTNFERFNSIYRSIYDDKKLTNYWDYPLTWSNSIKDNVGYTRINMRLLKTFFKIICNKELANNKYLIRGHKTVVVKVTDEEMTEQNKDQIRELFEFIYDVDKHQDKLNILRNTMTIYLDSNSDTNNVIFQLDDIVKSVNYNFNLYIQDKVKLFLDQKNKLLQEFINTTKKIEELTNSLILQFRTIFLSLLGTVFLSLMNNVYSSKSRAVLNLVLISYLFYFLINLIVVVNQKYQKDALLTNLDNYTRELGVLGENKDNNLSYDSLKVKYLNDSLNIYDKYRQWIVYSLKGLIVLFLLLYASNRFKEFPQLKEFIKFIIGY